MELCKLLFLFCGVMFICALIFKHRGEIFDDYDAEVFAENFYWDDYGINSEPSIKPFFYFPLSYASKCVEVIEG